MLTAAGLTWGDLFAQPRGSVLPPSPRAPLDEARADVLREARRQQARLAPLYDTVTVADAIRRCYRSVDTVRHSAQNLGDMPATWGVLASAAKLETHAYALEAALDD